MYKTSSALNCFRIGECEKNTSASVGFGKAAVLIHFF